MDAEAYTVVYDILRDGIGVAPVAVCLGMLIGLGFGVSILVWQFKHRKPVGCLIVWLIAWATGSLLGGGNVLYQHVQCVAWARSGVFEVVEGRVTHFHPRARSEKGHESFTVKGITFSYGKNNLGQGGFRYQFGPDGLLHEGVLVRVSHREGRILKLEIHTD
jgi:hypothetical protein